MSQSLVFILLLLALVLPMLGAIILRILAPRLSARQLYGAATLIFGIAVVSVLVLARSDISSLQVGGLSLLLPVVAPSEQDLGLPPLTMVPAPGESTPTGAVPPATESPPATSAPAGTAIMAATAPPTEEPPTAVPPTPVRTGRRTYTVQPGDTLRGIAQQFDVSVQAIIEANNLTPAQADSLRIGQELVIP
jgi:hypothetical protein